MTPDADRERGGLEEVEFVLRDAALPVLTLCRMSHPGNLPEEQLMHACNPLTG